MYKLLIINDLTKIWKVKGHIWKTVYGIHKSSNCIKFKFICHSKTYDKWEEGGNRSLGPKTSD